MSRKSLQPYWLKRIFDKCNGVYVDHFCRPHFDASGIGLRVMNPRYLEVSGPKITVGEHVHLWL